jgi:hypothetical protein
MPPRSLFRGQIFTLGKAVGGEAASLFEGSRKSFQGLKHKIQGISTPKATRRKSQQGSVVGFQSFHGLF